jgi:DNA-binding NtrC family response regulator
MKSHETAILIVDDDVDTCRNLSDILTDLGYRVDTANDGPTALKLVQQRRYDVALLDLKMPGMDGLTLYREIKKLRAGTVAIIVTAYASRAVAEEAFTAGAWKIVPKPIDFPNLVGLVDEALDQPMVMVVDDDTDLCTNLWDLLHQQGYRVCIAHDEASAAEQLKEQRFKIVLIDLKLPQGDGTSVLRLVHEAHPQARTILITGYRSETEQIIQRALAEGADTVCYKPFDMPILLHTMKQLANPIRDPGSGVRGQESGVRSQESGTRNLESGTRNQESGVRD